MKFMTTALFAFLLTFVGAGQVRAQEEALSCEEYRCIFQQRLEAECPCTGQSNHGRYVSCVAHLVNDLVDEGLPKNCKGKLKRCAAKSVCGKQEQGFSTCTIQTYGTCLEGICDTDATTVCTANTDCIASSQCKTTRHADRCLEAGGLVNLAPTCCSNCTTAP